MPHTAEVQALLVAIVLLCACYFMVPEHSGDERAGGRDFDKEHQLGAHRHTKAAGCRRCR